LAVRQMMCSCLVRRCFPREECEGGKASDAHGCPPL
jgi:hypothetical protein